MAHIQKLLKISLIALFSVSVGGCGASLLVSRDSNPTIEDFTGNWLRRMLTGDAVSTFSTTASRRMVIVNNLDDKVNICSEAPPDVGEAFASAVADGLKNSIIEPKSGITNETMNNYARTVATQITPLVYRTQGLQLYRDAMYSLCLDRMNWSKDDYHKMPIEMLIPQTSTKTTTQTTTDKNGNTVTITTNETITDNTRTVRLDITDYNVMRAFYMIQAVEAIKAELPVMLKAQEKFFQFVKAGEAKIDIDSLKKIIDAVNPKAVVNGSDSKPATAAQ